MKSFMILITLIFLTAGCRQDSETTSAPQEAPVERAPSSAPKPGPQIKARGGGVDSSGGDLVTSTNDQVEDSTKDIEDKVYNVVFRLQTEMIGAEKTDFELKFGEGSYPLVRDFLRSKGKFGMIPTEALKAKKIAFNIQEKPCIGDHQHKAGSAYWLDGKTPTACLSKSYLREKSPNSVQIDALALALHEVSHLFGFGEDASKLIQVFALKNARLLWPDQEQLALALRQSDDAVAHAANLLDSFIKKLDGKLCSTHEKMQEEVMRILQTRNNKTSIVLPSIAISPLGVVPMFGENVRVACDNGAIPLIRKAVAKTLPNMLLQLSYVNNLLRIYANPMQPKALLPTFTYMNILSGFEDPEIMATAYPKANANARIEMEDVVCSFQEKALGSTGDFSAPQIVSGRQFHGDKLKGLGLMNRSDNREEPYMLRRIEGQRGVGFAVMSETIQVSPTENLAPTNGGGAKSVQLFAGVLIPDVATSLQFEATTKTAVLRVRCGYKVNGVMPKLDYEISKTEPNAVDENDSHFIATPLKPIELTIKLNVAGKNDVSGGPQVAKEKILKVRFNGHVIIKTEHESCTLPEELFTQKKLSAETVAKSIRDGKFKDLTCEMNGTERSDGKYSHANWAFDFNLK